MQNEITVDLRGITTNEQVLETLGEVFEFGGPEGNFPADESAPGTGWGMNWDAVRDSLTYLAEGGIWGTSKKFQLPLTVALLNTRELTERAPETYATLRDVLSAQQGVHVECT